MYILEAYCSFALREKIYKKVVSSFFFLNFLFIALLMRHWCHSIIRFVLVQFRG